MKKLVFIIVLACSSWAQNLPDAPVIVKVAKSPYTFERQLWRDMSKQERIEVGVTRAFWLIADIADDRTTVTNINAGGCVETNTTIVRIYGNKPSAGQLATVSLVEGAIAFASQDILMKLLHGTKAHYLAHTLPVTWGVQHAYGGAWHNWKLRAVCGVR